MMFKTSPGDRTDHRTCEAGQWHAALLAKMTNWRCITPCCARRAITYAGCCAPLSVWGLDLYCFYSRGYAACPTSRGNRCLRLAQLPEFGKYDGTDRPPGSVSKKVEFCSPDYLERVNPIWREHEY